MCLSKPECVCVAVAVSLFVCVCVSAVCMGVCVNHRVPNKYAMKIDYKARQKKAKSFLLLYATTL